MIRPCPGGGAPGRFAVVNDDPGQAPRLRTVLYEFAAMPSLIRLLMVVGLLGGFAYGAMFALANFVQPKQREMSITIPAQRLAKPN
jgi:hypothetical protein